MGWSSRKKKEDMICTVYFLTFVFYLNVQRIGYTFRIYMLLHVKKHYFIHFCCSFLKSSKAFSVPANTSTLNQRWNNVDCQNSSTLIFGWKWKLSRRTFIDVVSTLTKQRWNNVDRITSIQRRWTNVVSTLKFGWKWKLNRRIFMDVVSTLTNQR